MSKKIDIIDWIKSIISGLENVHNINYYYYSPIYSVIALIVNGEIRSISTDSKNELGSYISNQHLEFIKNYINNSKRKIKILLTLEYLVRVLGGIKESYTIEDIQNMVKFFFRNLLKVNGIMLKGNNRAKYFIFNEKIILFDGEKTDLLTENNIETLSSIIEKIVFFEEDDFKPLYKKDNYIFIDEYLKEFENIYANKH